jgi:hypothetical protein
MDTVLKRFAQAAVLLALVLLPPAQAQEDDIVREGYFEVRSASTELVDGVVRLDARLQLILSSEALAALESGVPLRIELETQIIRQKRFMPDSTEAELNVRFELEYRPLSERYVVRNLNSGEQETFATLYSALNFLGRIDRLPLIDDRLLEQDKRYRVRLRALLQTQQYSAPLRLLFFWRSQWQLKSEWYEWSLER